MAQQYQPAYYQPPVKPGNGFGVTALVLGIVGFFFAFIPLVNLGTFILGSLAIIFGIVGVVQANRPKGMAIAGMIVGFVSLCVAVFVSVLLVGAISATSQSTQVAAQPRASSAPDDSATDSAVDPAAPQTGLEVLTVDAAELLAEFDANEAAADLKYTGKVLEVTGNVNGVDTEFLDDTQYIVQLDDGAEFSFTRVNCNDVSTDQAAAITPDSTITIRGTFDDGGDLGVDLKDCVVL